MADGGPGGPAVCDVNGVCCVQCQFATDPRLLQGLQLAVEVEEFADLHQAVGSSVRDVPAQQVFRNWRVRFPLLADAVL